MYVVTPGATKSLPITGAVGLLGSAQVLQIGATLNVLGTIINTLPLGLPNAAGWAVNIVSNRANITVPLNTPAGFYRVKLAAGGTVDFEVVRDDLRRAND